MKGIEVAETAQEQDRKKLWISCATCGLTKTFYTQHGLRYFELAHSNHEVQRGKPETKEIEPMAKEESAEAPSDEFEEAPLELPTIQLEKFVVSLVTSGPEKKQSLRVSGIGPEEKEFFVLKFPMEDASEVRALIEEGEYVEDDISSMGRFTWTPQLLEVSDQVSSLLGLREPTKAEIPKEVVAVSEPEPAEVKNAKEIPQPEAKAEAVLVIQRAEVKKEVPLLLAKSSYIQENEESRNEATRISKVLMEFRWNIAPPYGINVLFDDNMSIQTNTGVISANLVKKIESIGYTFVAFEASQGTPTVWFKKKRKEDDSEMTLFPDVGEIILPNPLHEGNGFANSAGEPVH